LENRARCRFIIFGGRGQLGRRRHSEWMLGGFAFGLFKDRRNLIKIGTIFSKHWNGGDYDQK